MPWTHIDAGLKTTSQTADHKKRISRRQFNKKNHQTDLELGADGLRLEADVKNGNVS